MSEIWLAITTPILLRMKAEKKNDPDDARPAGAKMSQSPSRQCYSFLCALDGGTEIHLLWIR
jgi:hypothetical protein